MTRFDAGDARARALLILSAIVFGAGAVWFDRLVAFPGGPGLSLLSWWIALALIASSTMIGAPAAYATLRLRLPAGALVIFLHGLVWVGCLILPISAWMHAPSLTATLAIAGAATIALLLPWRVWPMLALALTESGKEESGRNRPVWRQLMRAYRSSVSLTAERDVFLGHGMPVLMLHGIVLLLPGVLLLPIATSWTVRIIAVPLAVMAAWAVYRFVHSRSATLLDAARSGHAAESAVVPIPGNALLRAAALRDALRQGLIERALAIVDAGTDPTVPALPDESDQRDALTIAATLNDSRPIRAMIAAGADVNHRCHGATPLLAATRDSYYGRAETVLALLANGADLHACDEGGRTPLHHAALSADPAVAAMLLDAGAPVDAIDEETCTPLGLACAAGNAALVALLLERRASTAPDGSFPALCAAAGAPRGETGIVTRLLRAKAASDCRDGDQWTPLHHAVLAGHVEIARALIAAGASVDARDRDGRTPLHLACRIHDTDAPIVAVLRESGADAEIADADGVTALMLMSRFRPPAIAAETNGDEPSDTVDALLADGRQSAVRVWLKAATDEQRAELALAAARQGIVRSMEQALAVPLPADVRMPDGRKLIDAALDQAGSAHALLRALPGACVAVTGGGYLARLLARADAMGCEGEAVAMIWLDAGADPFCDHDGTGGPLHRAVALGYERLAVRLMERGVDARRGDRRGITPLHLALKHPDEQAARLVLALLRHGADPEAPSGSGETPLALALDANRPALVEWLRWRSWRLPGRRLSQHDLVEAAQCGDPEAVHRLLASGLAIDGRDRQGCTALIRAAGGGHRAVLEDLLHRGADVSARAHSGTTALTAALLSGHHELIDRLIAHGAAVDQRLANETTALIVAAACGRNDGIDQLLAAGADIGACDASGNTALHAAAGFAFGCVDGEAIRRMLLKLIAAGADVEAVNGTGLTPLHVVCGAAATVRANGAGIEAALDVLLSRVRAVTCEDDRGCTALHYAAAHGQLTVVRRLLARGAESGHRDRSGWTAENYAVHYGFTEVAQTLKPAAFTAGLPLRPG